MARKSSVKPSDGESKKTPDDKMILDLVNQLNKKHGEGTVFWGNDMVVQVPVISTGSLTVDIATGIGGIPLGRMSEIYGMESSGKTTLCLSLIAQAQRDGILCAFIDTENALDRARAETAGCDLSKMLITQPSSGENAFDIIEQIINTGLVKLVVVDSMALMIPSAQIAGDMGDSHVGIQARMISQGLQRLLSPVKDNGVALVFTNQLRQQIKTGFGGFGGPTTTTPGGMAPKFYFSMRIQVTRKSTTKNKEGVSIGNTTIAKLTKNKLAAPFKETEFYIDYSCGVSLVSDILTLAIENDIIKKSGAFFTIDDTRIQGAEKAKKYLADNFDITYNIHCQIAELYGLPRPSENVSYLYASDDNSNTNESESVIVEDE